MDGLTKRKNPGNNHQDLFTITETRLMISSWQQDFLFQYMYDFPSRFFFIFILFGSSQINLEVGTSIKKIARDGDKELVVSSQLFVFRGKCASVTSSTQLSGCHLIGFRSCRVEYTSSFIVWLIIRCNVWRRPITRISMSKNVYFHENIYRFRISFLYNQKYCRVSISCC